MGHPTQFPAFIAFVHVDLTGYSQTVCIHLTACSVDGISYTLFACWSACQAFFDGCLGCHCPRCCTKGMRYQPWLSRTPMRMGLPLHVMRMSCSLCAVTPSLVKIDIMPLSAVLPMLISECGNSVNVSACLAEVDNV